MEIKIYAPVDCEVKELSQSTDDMFAQKLMGEGLLIVPKNNDFNSFLKEATVALIFETKHAIFLETNDIKVLMHIGLDSVKLNGEPFNLKILKGQEVNLQTQLLNVNLDILTKNGYSTETPIVFDSENIKSIEVNVVKTDAKKGEHIATVLIEKKVKENVSELLELEEFESKYLKVAKDTICFVGGVNNYEKVYNCMTRLRFIVKDKSLVQIENLKKIDIVKGINWNGNELQVIIGGECYKVKDEILKLESGFVESKKQNVKKPPFYKRLMVAIAGIMMPQIPALMAVALFSALNAILIQANIIENYETAQNPSVWSLFFYIMGNVGLNLIGVIFCYSVVSYFNGNRVLAILVGLTLTAKYFIAGVAVASVNPGFGDYINDPANGVSGWLLFKLGNYPIVVSGYEGSVLPFITAGLIIVFVDKWVKTWMPTSVDVVFRPFIVYAAAMVPVLFLLGPFLGMIELGLSKIVMNFEKDATGLANATFAFFWQILVLTGVHGAISLTVIIGSVFHDPVIATTIIPAMTVAAFTQIGASIGVAIRTKNPQMKAAIIGATPAAFFGITEPIIYGVNLPKLRPFLCGCVGAFVSALFIKWLDLSIVRMGGMGVFAVIGHEGFKDQALIVLVWIIGMGVAMGLTILTYSEKRDEYKYSKKLIAKMNQKALKILLTNGVKKTEALEMLNSISSKFLEELLSKKVNFKNYANYLSNKSSIEQKIIKLESKEEKIKNAKYKKAIKLKKASAKIDIKIVNAAIIDYKNFNLNSEKEILTKKLSQLELDNKLVVSEYYESIDKFTNDYQEIIQKYLNITKYLALKNYEAGFFNAINACEINYEIVDEKQLAFSRKEKRDFKVMIKNQI